MTPKKGRERERVRHCEFFANKVSISFSFFFWRFCYLCRWLVGSVWFGLVGLAGFSSLLNKICLGFCVLTVRFLAALGHIKYWDESTFELRHCTIHSRDPNLKRIVPLCVYGIVCVLYLSQMCYSRQSRITYWIGNISNCVSSHIRPYISFSYISFSFDLYLLFPFAFAFTLALCVFCHCYC